MDKEIVIKISKEKMHQLSSTEGYYKFIAKLREKYTLLMHCPNCNKDGNFYTDEFCCKYCLTPHMVSFQPDIPTYLRPVQFRKFDTDEFLMLGTKHEPDNLIILRGE